MTEPAADGIHALPPRECMDESARKLRDIYDIVPGAPLFRREFGYYCLDQWYEQGLSREADLAEEFGYDPGAEHGLGQLGWCEAAFLPAWEDRVLEQRGDHELVQDYAGRHVLYFAGRRDGFMPEYVGHPVTDMRSWEEDVAWRLDPASPGRFADLEARMEDARGQAQRGIRIVQGVIGGYMYLRSLIGPAELPVMLVDQPEVIHAAMRAWLALTDAVVARHQAYVTLDEFFLAEDICYNHGCLISPRMMREFLLPYYQQAIANVRSRQIDRSRHLYIHVDTDGHAPATIPIYREIGMDVMSPFEVASGCDVVAIGREYPDLVMFGGIDKRVLAGSKAGIDAMVDRILPAMRARGGFIPTCDHGVPEEVSLDNYRHYRRRCLELGG